MTDVPFHATSMGRQLYGHTVNSIASVSPVVLGLCGSRYQYWPFT